METYCLGHAHEKCKTCERHGNWVTLNQMPDTLRRKMQQSMVRADIDYCALTKMSQYKPVSSGRTTSN